MSADGFAICRTLGLSTGRDTVIFITDIRLSVDILRGHLVVEVKIVATVKQEYVSDLPHVPFHRHSFEVLNANGASKARYFEM